jgi:hypothetical protein
VIAAVRVVAVPLDKPSAGVFMDSRPSSMTRRWFSAAAALFDDLRIARMLQGTRPVQAFLTVRKRPKCVFQAQMLIAGFG